jgi:hypothetical protein
MGLALLANTSMPLKYWDQVFLTATHLINRTPPKVIDYDTPIHCLLRAQLNYSTLRVFGCAYWPNLRLYNSNKVQFRSTRCAFLSYSNLHKGYKCLNISMGRVYISRDVIFDEGVFPFAHLSSTAAARYFSDVLLLPNESPVRASIEAPMDNSHVISCLSNPIFVTNQQLPQRIPEQVPDPLRRANSEVDPILSLATTTAPTAGSGADFHADPVTGMLPLTAPTSGVPSATPTAPHVATRLPPASTPHEASWALGGPITVSALALVPMTSAQPKTVVPPTASTLAIVPALAPRTQLIRDSEA